MDCLPPETEIRIPNAVSGIAHEQKNRFLRVPFDECWGNCRATQVSRSGWKCWARKEIRTEEEHRECGVLRSVMPILR